MSNLQLLTVIVLLLAMVFGAVGLVLESRQRRINRQLNVALPTARLTLQQQRSLRRQRTNNKLQPLYRLFNFERDVVYIIQKRYVFLVATIVVAGVAFVGNFLEFSTTTIVLASVGAAVITARGLFGWQLNRFRNHLFVQLPDVVELVTTTVRAGLPVVAAFDAVAREMPEPTSSQFALVVNEISLGTPPEEALDHIYRRTGVPEYSMFAVTLGVQLKAGGSLAETLQTLGSTVRQRAILAARAKALAGEVIFSSRALSAAPFLVCGLMYMINHTLVDKLFTDPTGKFLLGYAGTSVLLGILIIRWMIRRGTAL